MPARSGTSIKKRQKEVARMEKQREKAARRMQRRLAKKESGATMSGELTDPPQPPSGTAD